MSLLKDIAESNDDLKAIFILLLIMPFWHLTFFLFNNSFFSNNTLITLITFYFCLTFLSSLIMLWGFSFFNIEVEETDYTVTFSAISLIIQVIWISLLILINYLCSIFFNSFLKLFWFIIIYFIPIILFPLFMLITNKKRLKQIIDTNINEKE